MLLKVSGEGVNRTDGAGLVGFTHDSERRLRHTVRVGLLKQARLFFG